MFKLFNSLLMEISSSCNRGCQFCPVAYNTRPDERMDESILMKCLTELGSIRYTGRIEFYLYNEPTKDFEWLLHCARTARATVPRATLMIATNGDYLRGASRITQLYDAGLNQLLINCYSPGLYEKRQAWLKDLIDVDQGGKVYTVSNSGYRSKVLGMLDKSDITAFGRSSFRLMNRAGNIPAFLPSVDKPVKRVCTKLFRQLAINWKGQALICCQDYHGAHSYGDVATSTLEELWRHPVMNTYRRHSYKKDRAIPLCEKCDQPAGVYPWSIAKPEGPYTQLKSIKRGQPLVQIGKRIAR